MHYPNTKNNVSKILNRRNDGYNTIICNAPCQSGKTDIVPCLQTEFKDSGLFIPIVSDNHLYDENERAIREQNIQVRCEKLKDTLDILENGGSIPYSPFIACDEVHVGQKEYSRFNDLIIGLNKYYKQKNWGRPFYILLGATNWQLMYAHNHGTLSKELFGRIDALDLEVGENYFGAQEFLDHKNIIFKNPIDGINKLENNELHPFLLEELSRLDSEDLKQTFTKEGLSGYPIGLIRVASSADDGEQLAQKINLHFKDKIHALAVNSTDGKKIQSSFTNALRESYNKPTIIIACQGISMGIRFPLKEKLRIAFAIEDRKVISSVAQSFLGRLMGYRDPENPFPIPCNMYNIDENLVQFLANFDIDSASLNDKAIEDLPFIQESVAIATHMNAKFSRKYTRSVLHYDIIPNNIKLDEEIRKYYEEKYKDKLLMATSPTFSHEKYENSYQNDIQKVLREEGEKGGGNRLTRFHNPNAQNKNFPESKKELRNALESPNHSLTRKILEDLDVTPEQLLAAFDEGRLIRIKITYPDDRVDVEINNNVFCEQ
jgi:hypothetical protein